MTWAENAPASVAGEEQSNYTEIRARLNQVNIAALRKAVVDLMETFPDKYLHGGEYLKRLEEYEKRFADIGQSLIHGGVGVLDRAVDCLEHYEAFKYEAPCSNPLVSGQEEYSYSLFLTFDIK